jgi:hypothetical protein
VKSLSEIDFILCLFIFDSHASRGRRSEAMSEAPSPSGRARTANAARHCWCNAIGDADLAQHNL